MPKIVAVASNCRKSAIFNAKIFKKNVKNVVIKLLKTEKSAI